MARYIEIMIGGTLRRNSRRRHVEDKWSSVELYLEIVVDGTLRRNSRRRYVTLK